MEEPTEKLPEDYASLRCNQNRCRSPTSVPNLVRQSPILRRPNVACQSSQSPKRRPIELVFRAARADMEPVFILITNRNLDFELGDGARNNCRKRQQHRDQIEICFVHTLSDKAPAMPSFTARLALDKIVAGRRQLNYQWRSNSNPSRSKSG